MIAKVSARQMRRGPHGQLRNTISDRDARRIFATYKRTGSIVETGRLHGGRAGATIWALLNRRGLIKSRRPTKRKVRSMYRYYSAGHSLGEVGDKYGRTRQAVFDMFKVRGFKLRTRVFQTAVIYRGRKYTPAKSGYLRDTIGRTPGAGSYLHHIVWEEHNGPIPAGHKVIFSDGDRLNCKFRNLELLTRSQQSQRHSTGENQFTRTAGTRLKLIVGNFETGTRSLASDLKAREA